MNERSIFVEALEKEDPAQRSAFLDTACAGDAVLRQRLEALLRSHAEAEGFLGKPAPERLAEELAEGQTNGETQSETPTGGEESGDLGFLTPPDKAGSLGRLAHYDVQEIVGRGGMGVVLRAFDEKLHRVVAIKVMAAQLATNANARKRFRREAQAGAAVSHDHVVALHGVDEANGLPYLVMQYVSGVSLQERLDRGGPLELQEILRIGMQTASGLDAAHKQGLIHRDIKPANILLENGVERVKITDFGLARAAADASLTQSGVVAGTPQYMSPEQARGEAVDQRTDLFSLGSVLYAMCTGRAPFRASGSMAVLKRVCEEAPTRIRETNPEVPDWLVAIVDKLHAKDPAERFQSAAEVAELLGQHLAHLQHPSVAPLPPHLPLGKGAGREGGPRGRRRRWAVVALALLLGGLFLTEATGVTNLLATVIRIFTPDGTLIVEVDDPGVKVTVEGDGGLVITGAGPQEVRLKPGSYRVEATKDGKPVKHEAVTITQGGKQVVKVSIEGEARAPAPLPSGEIRRFLGHTGLVWNVAYSPNGRHALSRGSDQTVRLWDVKGGKELRRFEAHQDSLGSVGVAFSSDGRLAICGHRAGGMMLWEVETGKELRRFGAGAGPVNCLAFSPNDKHALSGGPGGVMILWDVHTGKELRRFRGHKHSIYSVAFSPDGRQALSGGGGEFKDGVYQPPQSDHSVRLWDVETGQELGRFGHRYFVCSVAFSPDGRYGLSGSYDGTMRLWDLRKRQEVRVFKPGAGVNSVAFSPDGRFALSGGDMNYISLWEVDTGIRLQRFEGHTKKVQSLAFSPDGRSFLSGSWDGSMRLWQLPEAGSGQAPQPERDAFVLLGGKGIAERKFDTLAEAVQGASDGDTIEIRGNGPFITQPIHIRSQALTIRAGEGFRPVLRLSPEGTEAYATLIETNAPLTLEGLELQTLGGAGPKTGGQPEITRAVRSRAAPLFVAHCRFLVKGEGSGISVVGVPVCELRHCEMYTSGPLWWRLGWKPPPGGRLLMDNNILVGGIEGLAVWNDLPDLSDVAIQVSRNTIASRHGVSWLLSQLPRGDGKDSGNAKMIRLHATANIIDQADAIFHLAQPPELIARTKALSAAQAEALLPKWFAWSETGNLYPPTRSCLRLTVNGQDVPANQPIKDLASWKRFWGLRDLDARQGRPQYERADVLSRVQAAAPVQPADFRLADGSPGKGAGKGGTDLGADVDLVGPGPAYERWKKTPEYQQWLKDTGQTKK